MKSKKAVEIVHTLLFTGMVSALLMRLPVAKASTDTVLSVSPTSIIDQTLGPNSIFRINITVAQVQHMWGAEFMLSYNTSVLTATSYGLYLPFQNFAPSEINDGAGYVDLAFYTYIGDHEGFTTIIPVPTCWIEFLVDSLGTSWLDLHDSDIYITGYGLIYPIELDGFFANIPYPPPVPEFPLGSAMPVAAILLLLHLWRRRKQNTPS